MERETKKSLNIEQIQQIIPHRHPFCLIDRIEDYEPGEFAIGYKAVTYTEIPTTYFLENNTWGNIYGRIF